MRRERVERGVYKAERKNGWVYEIGWYDSTGKQRWMTVGTDLEEAKRLREEYAEIGVGGGSKYRRHRKDLFRIAEIADKWPSPSKLDIIDVMRQTSGDHPRRAWIMLAGFALAKARSYERK